VSNLPVLIALLGVPPKSEALLIRAAVSPDGRRPPHRGSKRTASGAFLDGARQIGPEHHRERCRHPILKPAIRHQNIHWVHPAADVCAFVDLL
jgi:hypothetical protein